VPNFPSAAKPSAAVAAFQLLALVEFEAQRHFDAGVQRRGEAAMPSTLLEALCQQKALVDYLNNEPFTGIGEIDPPEDRAELAGAAHAKSRVHLAYGKAIHAMIGEIESLAARGQPSLAPFALSYLGINPETILPTMPETLIFHTFFEAEKKQAIVDIEEQLDRLDLPNRLKDLATTRDALAESATIGFAAHVPQISMPSYLESAYKEFTPPGKMSPLHETDRIDRAIAAHRKAWGDVISGGHELLDVVAVELITTSSHDVRATNACQLAVELVGNAAHLSNDQGFDPHL
jgi:hypothetical protein